VYLNVLTSVLLSIRLAYSCISTPGTCSSIFHPWCLLPHFSLLHCWPYRIFH